MSRSGEGWRLPDWRGREWRVVRRVVLVALGAFAIGYLAAALWIRAGSSGRAIVTVPDLRGLSAAEAQRAVSGADLVMEPMDSLPHPEVPRGHVLTQSPLPAQEVAPGTAVQVILSSGRARHPVPRVEGLTREQAERMLRATSMTPVVEEVHDTRRAGTVVGTQPAAGTEVEVPARLRLQVSLGPPLVEVPDLLGLHESELEPTLAAAELLPGEITRELRLMEEEGRVVGQSPPAGDSIPQGSAVDVTVSTLRLEPFDPDGFR